MWLDNSAGILAPYRPYLAPNCTDTGNVGDNSRRLVQACQHAGIIARGSNQSPLTGVILSEPPLVRYGATAMRSDCAFCTLVACALTVAGFGVAVGSGYHGLAGLGAEVYRGHQTAPVIRSHGLDISISLPLTLNGTIPPAPTPTPIGTINTVYGPVVGTPANGAWRFLGIPYAAPPLGELRWQPPDPPTPWTEPLSAAKFGSACPQYDEDGTLFGSEDCLTLNVYAPEGALQGGEPRPVLFFLHGGGHVQGSSRVLVGDLPLYDGTSLATNHDVVVITINYRLGPFGFLAHPALSAEGGEKASGNYGALDQLAALQWVQRNVAGFGGDPSRVTVFGESAGSVSSCRLVASPLAEGLLDGAILMSGACVASPLARAEANGREVAAALGCADATDVPSCLRGRSTAAVMNTLEPGVSGPGSLGRGAYDGVIDGYLLPDAPRQLIEADRHNHVPVIVGTTSGENGRDAPPIASAQEYEAAVRAYLGAAGLPSGLADQVLEAYPVDDYASARDAYVALTSDLKFVCPARQDLRLFAAAGGAATYRYWFDHVADNAGPQARARGAFHGSELPFLFGVLEFSLGPIRYRPGPGDLATSAAMGAYWARFAATGNPNGDAGAAWPLYEPERDPSLVLGSEPKVHERLRAEQCAFWESLARR